MEKIAGETRHDYIGDGVYVSFDGFQIWLRTRGLECANEIALEPAAFRNLIRYAASIEGWEGSA